LELGARQAEGAAITSFEVDGVEMEVKLACMGKT